MLIPLSNSPFPKFLRKMPGLIVALSVLFSSNCAFSADLDLEKICRRVEKTQFPSVDQPTPQEIVGLKDCESKNLYFGIGTPVDYVKARKCAYSEMEQEAERRNEGGALLGSDILMMIYANGKGAKRNLDLAIKLACKEYGRETEVWITNLEKMRRTKGKENNFYICNKEHLISGVMMANCAYLEEDISAPQRKIRMAELTGNWPDSDKKCFGKVENAFEQFLKHHLAENGPALTRDQLAHMISTETELREKFLSTLEKFERGALPKDSPEKFKKADKELNRIYRELLKEFIEYPEGGITKESIKETQRKWIRYRDAWVSFGKQRYPKVSAESWMTFFTLERIKTFKEF